MIQAQLKLRLTKKQESKLNAWLWHLTGVWNWAIRKIELDAKDKIYYSRMGFRNLLANHSDRLGIPSHTLQGILVQAHVTFSNLGWDAASRRPAMDSINRNLMTMQREYQASNE